MIPKKYFAWFKRLSHARLYLVSSVVLLAFASTLFFIEYHRFCVLARELLDLREDYRVYTLALKKTLDEATSSNGQTGDQKKKSTELDEEGEETPFVTVNRDDEYLLTNAVAFARKYQLAESVARLYDEGEWEKHVRLRRSSPQPKKRTKRFVAAPRTTQTSYKLPVEPRDFTFMWPIDRSKFWLSSFFGPRRIRHSGVKFHYGIDMAANKGTPVKAAASGIVLESYWNNGYGNCIIIAHNRKYKTRYAHLDTRRVKVGQKVKGGDVIGTVGDTGLVRKSGRDASHLHFEVYAFGRHINPLSVLA